MTKQRQSVKISAAKTICVIANFISSPLFVSLTFGGIKRGETPLFSILPLSFKGEGDTGGEVDNYLSESQPAESPVPPVSPPAALSAGAACSPPGQRPLTRGYL